MSFAKLEFFNPFSRSIKDRAVYNMLIKALRSGEIDGTNVLYEATSGNVGISIAALSAVFGLKFRAYIPKPTPKTTELLIKVFGAEVVRTNFDTIDKKFVEFVKLEARRDKALNLNQFENDANFEAHYYGTARELEEQLRSIDKIPEIIIAGIGTSGHIAGISKYFKERYETKIIGVVPAKGETIPGIKRLETRPKWFFKVEVDEVVEVTAREAFEGILKVARSDGLLIGMSSGAVVKAYEKVRPEGTTVLIFPDDGFKYGEIFEMLLGEAQGKISSRTSQLQGS
ncbi:pyridoxal-phosphate dependent enzyme [Pyrococcus abyssi]|uniref:CysM cysteine synthase n=1 Tax=Pyrococcus abyssi (strain GE5 / Orsay) TaxID=272844 RepID=Q9V1Q3_PYRAB|nr:PLP-dependent cysteine synthase family protein [Pyrococcus abyssi]CAB49296.1 cysM cysteine synthase (EC 4.2.99.8) [Pyrococcus abyssi GE5]CCE69751.1 TPA: cysteine synthase, o-acetylserine (thiol) lyase b [Pyrococcus abyssi GE5]